MYSSDDQIREILQQMSSVGIDLARKQQFDFRNVFESKEGAEEFIGDVQKKGYRTELIHHSELKVWFVYVSREMLPTQENISAVEEELLDLAWYYGGFDDGWGVGRIEN